MPEPDALAQGMPDVFVAALVEQLRAQAGVRLCRHPDARRGRGASQARRSHLDRAQFQTRSSVKREACLFFVKQEFLRIQGEPMLGPAMHGTLAHAGETAARLFQDGCRILDQDACLWRKVVEEGAETGMEDGSERLAAEKILASFDLLQQVAGFARWVGGLVGCGQQARPHIGSRSSHGFPHRVERHSVDGPQGALGGGVVQAD